MKATSSYALRFIHKLKSIFKMNISSSNQTPEPEKKPSRAQQQTSLDDDYRRAKISLEEWRKLTDMLSEPNAGKYRSMCTE